MTILKALRLFLVLGIICLSIFYIKLNQGSVDRSRYIISSAERPLFKIEGDYIGQINILNKNISVDESVLFEKDSLVESIRKVNSVQLGSYGETFTREVPLQLDSIQIQSYLVSYFGDLKELGWVNVTITNSSKISLKRRTSIPLSIGVFEKTKRLTIPILFTNVNEILTRSFNMGFHVKNDSIGKLEYDRKIDYILSSRSKILLKAREGLVQRIFPEAKKVSLIDEGEHDVYLFNLKSIGSTVDEFELKTTTINVEVINPMYNNLIGKTIRDWSVSQIIVWTIVTLLALFADKVKELFLKPIIDKFFAKKVSTNSPY
ncbi:MAG: hypothetical protein JWN56_489 [Sphingobacteriales bacterium]|nr:hypothetical protein [Sphingobacteriales bacterium]